jgi:hypothetical protein
MDKDDNLSITENKTIYQDTITFRDLVRELTGTSFEKVYKEYLQHGVDKNVENNLE